MPRDVIPTEYREELNLLGVLRNDGQRGASFVYVQRTMTTEEIYSLETDPVIRDAHVQLARDDTTWVFTQIDTALFPGYYADTLFRPYGNVIYRLTVEKSGIPSISGSTRVPPRPLLVEGSLEMGDGRLTAILLRQGKAAAYQVYLEFPDSHLQQELPGNRQDEVGFSFEWDAARNGTPSQLTLAALDSNLVAYQASAFSLLPNTYHEDGSTLNGGRGCFGSVGITNIALP